MIKKSKICILDSITSKTCDSMSRNVTKAKEPNTCIFCMLKFENIILFFKMPDGFKTFFKSNSPYKTTKIVTGYVFVYNFFFYKTAILSFCNGVKSPTKELECVFKTNLLHHSNVIEIIYKI